MNFDNEDMIIEEIKLKEEDYPKISLCRWCGTRTDIESDHGTHVVIPKAQAEKWEGDYYYFDKHGNKIFFYCDTCSWENSMTTALVRRTVEKK